MTDKYSPAKCEQYGRRLAARLCDQHFGAVPDTTLDGPAVLSFTPIRQLNLFVVRQLLHQWQEELNRLRSPYFDFSAPAVQTALIQFQNTLSRHIRLTRPVFEPLLAQAVSDALRLAADPASSFEHLLPSSDAAPTNAQLRESLRYFDINKEFFTTFLASLPPLEPLTRDQVIAQLRAQQEANYRPHQPMQLLVSALSALLPLTEADLWQDGPAATSTSTVTAPSSISSAPSPAPKPALAVPTPPTQAKPIADQPSLVATEKASAETTGTGLSPPAPALAEAPLHEKLKANQPPNVPLAAALRAAQPQPAALAERRAPKVESLREAISINQRFSFINELFNGENMEYHAAIQHLDSLADYDQARLYITQNLAQRYDWSRKDEHVAKLLKLIDRKFAPVV
ncbi:hypothetical protein [uncultured Hymenobacter sp.]|uniref:hypothetical protein n=1 Tax=uncultured Hymenobacter sp. TaxID=170016 RepID=UPI0035CA6730